MSVKALPRRRWSRISFLFNPAGKCEDASFSSSLPFVVQSPLLFEFIDECPCVVVEYVHLVGDAVNELRKICPVGVQEGSYFPMCKVIVVEML